MCQNSLLSIGHKSDITSIEWQVHGSWFYSGNTVDCIICQSAQEVMMLPNFKLMWQECQQPSLQYKKELQIKMIVAKHNKTPYKVTLVLIITYSVLQWHYASKSADSSNYVPISICHLLISDFINYCCNNKIQFLLNIIFN